MHAYYEYDYKVCKKYLFSQQLQNIFRGEDFMLYVADKFNKIVVDVNNKFCKRT
jgi:hypothetical protein